MKSHPVNRKNCFIDGWYIDPLICERLIDFYQHSQQKFSGGFGENQTDPLVKKSTECYLDTVHHELYCDSIFPLAQTYFQKYPPCQRVGEIGITERIKVQHYCAPDEAYYAWHSERDSVQTSKRYLTFMTYLNTIRSGGETEFYYQDLRVQPECGLTLIWPVDWTFSHRGVPSPLEDKFIVTGWFSFLDSEL